MKILIPTAVTALVSIPCFSAYAQNDGKFSLATKMDCYTGRHGGSQSTDILYILAIGIYRQEARELKLAVPCLKITGPGNVIKELGQTRTTTTIARTTHSGRGNVVVATPHPVYSDALAGIMVNHPAAKIKFRTAGSPLVLGTKQNNYSPLNGNGSPHCGAGATACYSF